MPRRCLHDAAMFAQRLQDRTDAILWKAAPKEKAPRTRAAPDARGTRKNELPAARRRRSVDRHEPDPVRTGLMDQQVAVTRRTHVPERADT